MTEAIRHAAIDAVPVGTEVIAAHPTSGPASIQGFYDVAVSTPGVLEVIGAHPNADAIVVACFDDTGVDAARCLTSAPVLGIGEAAFHAAAMVSCRFSVVTTLRRSVPGIEENLLRYGLDARCTGVRACELPVLALEDPETGARDVIAAEIEQAIELDHAEAIALGCAGMAHLAQDLTEHFGIPVIDGVAVAAALAVALVGAGLTTSKVGGYAPPLPSGRA